MTRQYQAPNPKPTPGIFEAPDVESLIDSLKPLASSAAVHAAPLASYDFSMDSRAETEVLKLDTQSERFEFGPQITLSAFRARLPALRSALTEASRNGEKVEVRLNSGTAARILRAELHALVREFPSLDLRADREARAELFTKRPGEPSFDSRNRSVSS